MELKIKTSELQEMVGKAAKCVSNNKLIPLTSLMSIKVEDNVLTLTTTDATNYFYVSKPEKVDCENFEVSVLADLFTKLIQKTTAEFTTLILNGAIMQVKGNGTYTMELPLDENGSTIKFPKKIKDEAWETAGIVKLSTIKNILAVNKASLADNMECPVLTCYYCGSKVITSDRKKICSTAIKVFDNPMIITAALMDLLGVLTDENIEVLTAGDSALYRTEHDVIYSPITEGVDTFPVKAIDSLVEQDFSSVCKISRSALLNVIDRLSLFVVPYDKHGIYLTFNNEGVLLSSKKSSGQELIPYISSENFSPYTCCIDIEMLRSQVVTQDSEDIELYYGSEVAIKMVNKNITQIVALLQDDRLEG